jgi:biotin carboxylase
MSVLILNQNTYEFFPFKDWLKEKEEEIIFFTNDTVGDQFADNRFLHFEVFSDYESGMVELRAKQLYETYHFDTVIALHEFDILRAAKIRESLGIQGQSYENALLYRDKLKMKSAIFQNSNVALPTFQEMEYPLDAVDFMEKHGYPFVIKPADSAGSMGTTVIRNETDLIDFLKKMKVFYFAEAQPANHLMLETYVQGEMYHVDGYIENNELILICASKYLENSLIYLDQNEISGSYLLSSDSELHSRLVEETKKVIQALGSPKSMIFHAEFFHTPDDQLVFCEIASRPGGARIIEMIEAAYGLHLTKAYTQSACGLNAPFTDDTPKRVGHIVPIPKFGKLVKAPIESPYPWIIRYRLNCKLGTTFDRIVHT